MSEQLRESLSALMDGESEELELRRVLAHKDTEMINKTWAGFHRSKDAMEGQVSPFSDWDISSKVSAALANETIEVVTEKEAKAQSFWLKPVAGLAVAASVMMAVVVGVQSLHPAQTGMTGEQPALASRVYPAAMSGGGGVGGVTVSAQVQQGVGLPGAQAAADLATQQRLEKFMLLHTEHAALNNGKGLMPYARVASFEAE